MQVMFPSSHFTVIDPRKPHLGNEITTFPHPPPFSFRFSYFVEWVRGVLYCVPGSTLSKLVTLLGPRNKRRKRKGRKRRWKVANVILILEKEKGRKVKVFFLLVSVRHGSQKIGTFGTTYDVQYLHM